MADEENDSDSPMIVIYVIPGSQFSFKVLAALEARKIDHYVEFVPVSLEARRKVLPSGGTMVPEMRVGTDTEGVQAVVVPDSEAILHWLDDHIVCKKQQAGAKTTTSLYPTEQTSELSLRASTKGLAGLVWYYNWVNQEGYEASMQQSIAVMALPSWIPCGRAFIVDMLVKEQREKHAKMAMEALDIDKSTLEDEQRMKELLLEELNFFQSLFGKQSSTEQPFLVKGFSEPTAADFSVYAQVQRLIGAGSASDVPIFPSLPNFRGSDKGQQLARLWEWYDLMCERFPVRFKGKRIPK